jgi:hypothetical protein
MPLMTRGLFRLILVAALCAGTWSVALAQQAGSGPAWTALKPTQQQILAPLQKDWGSLDAGRKSKWLEIAARYPSMPPEQQLRMRERMAEWSRMSPEERGRARLNFQQAQTLPAPDRAAQWEAYQALPVERKEALARQAASPVSAASGAQIANTSSLRKAPLDAQAPKNNLTPPPAPATAQRPIGPTLVQTGPGASTRLITQPLPAARPASAPPRAKIEVGQAVVDRTTLLPRPPTPVAPQAPTVAQPAAATVVQPPAPSSSASAPVTQ